MPVICTHRLLIYFRYYAIWTAVRS